MVGFGAVDQDGDVEMSVPQPIFEFIKAPKLAVWSQPALVRFLRDRRQYLNKVRERCMVTGEDQDNVTFSIKSSVEHRILEHLAHYVLRKPINEVTEDALRAEMERKAGSMMNDHVPDVANMFAEELKMDLREPDIEARVSKYFMDFDRLVEDQGLATWVGRGVASDVAGRQRMKTRCKLLVANLLPDVLRIDVERSLPKLRPAVRLTSGLKQSASATKLRTSAMLPSRTFGASGLVMPMLPGSLWRPTLRWNRALNLPRSSSSAAVVSTSHWRILTRSSAMTASNSRPVSLRMPQLRQL
ncbi:unnamed protein product [Phytophthora fragariaefolia]|uniref:Unnamed protein product n=1 Tax=Phytophthora fragariaefolia TaxID=1490495 RepID=A0A9W7D206_9STRA|nr:unnamed protein product [Phytophthora fragariaefolia]